MAVGEWTLYATIPPGCKGMVSHPAYGLIDVERDMSVDVEALAAHGVGRLVSMMSADDILSSGMGGLLTDLEGAGIEWTHLPFPSRHLPDDGFPRYMAEQVAVIEKDMRRGRRVALHGAGWGLRFARDLEKLVTAFDEALSPRVAKVVVTATLRSGRSIVPM